MNVTVDSLAKLALALQVDLTAIVRCDCVIEH